MKLQIFTKLRKKCCQNFRTYPFPTSPSRSSFYLLLILCVKNVEIKIIKKIVNPYKKDIFAESEQASKKEFIKIYTSDK